MRISKIILFAFLIGLCSCGESMYPDLEKGVYANINTIDGDILLELAFKEAPITVGNFVSLAEGTNKRVTDSMRGKPFYDGLKFHRVISFANGGSNNFMIQGGCPLGNGSGDPGYKFADEFPLDSIGNILLKHNEPGVLSMANSGPNKNGSQFFITLEARPHLDGVHTVFGHVIKGQEIADNMKQDTKIEKIDIIRVGKEARKFKAYKALEISLVETEEKEASLKRLQSETIANFAVLRAKATELSPDFKIYFTKKGDGKTPGLETSIRISYAVYFTDGKLLDTNRKELAQKYGTYNSNRDSQGGYEPFPSIYSMNAQLIQGFKEGLQEMKFGDKTVLFIPYHLAYGEQGGRGIPPKSDLIFELEMFPRK